MTSFCFGNFRIRSRKAEFISDICAWFTEMFSLLRLWKPNWKRFIATRKTRLFPLQESICFEDTRTEQTEQTCQECPVQIVPEWDAFSKHIVLLPNFNQFSSSVQADVEPLCVGCKRRWPFFVSSDCQKRLTDFTALHCSCQQADNSNSIFLRLQHPKADGYEICLGGFTAKISNQFETEWACEKSWQTSDMWFLRHQFRVVRHFSFYLQTFLVDLFQSSGRDLQCICVTLLVHCDAIL